MNHAVQRRGSLRWPSGRPSSLGLHTREHSSSTSWVVYPTPNVVQYSYQSIMLELSSGTTTLIPSSAAVILT